MECRRIKSRDARNAKRKLSGNYLGALCKRGHDRQETGKSLRRKRVLKQSDGSIKDGVFNKIKASAENCCYCKCRLTKKNKTIDHANPIGLGGSHSTDNIVVCCDKCNYQKSDMPLEKWLNRLKN